MKRFLALILALCMVFALAACGAPANDDPETTPPADISDTPAPEDSDEPAESDEPAAPPATQTPSTQTPSTQTPSAQTPSAGAALTDDELLAYLASVVAGEDDVMMPSSEIVPADNFSYIVGIEKADGYSAARFAPAVSSIAYEVVLVSLPEGADAASVASTIEANADPIKWVCVAADTVGTAVNGNLILFYMIDSAAFPDTVANITANFSAL